MIDFYAMSLLQISDCNAMNRVWIKPKVLGIIDFEVLACYMPWDLTCSLLACLLVGFSLNAQTKPSNELWECSLLIKSIKQIVQRENKSPYNSHMDSPVSIGTQSVSSISSDSVIFFFTLTLPLLVWKF